MVIYDFVPILISAFVPEFDVCAHIYSTLFSHFPLTALCQMWWCSGARKVTYLLWQGWKGPSFQLTPPALP